MNGSPFHQLTTYGLMAERHWREFFPKMVQRLETEGRLMEVLWEARETAWAEMEARTRKMERGEGMTPGQAQTAAWELVREKYILLPPENPNA